jgi:hypothetical protein
MNFDSFVIHTQIFKGNFLFENDGNQFLLLSGGGARLHPRVNGTLTQFESDLHKIKATTLKVNYSIRFFNPF